MGKGVYLVKGGKDRCVRGNGFLLDSFLSSYCCGATRRDTDGVVEALL